MEAHIWKTKYNHLYFPNIKHNFYAFDTTVSHIFHTYVLPQITYIYSYVAWQINRIPFGKWSNIHIIFIMLYKMEKRKIHRIHRKKRYFMFWQHGLHILVVLCAHIFTVNVFAVNLSFTYMFTKMTQKICYVRKIQTTHKATTFINIFHTCHAN